VVRIAPRVDERLVAAVGRYAEDKVPIAETCRRVGSLADHLGLTRPSYEEVRRLVHGLRKGKRAPSTGDVLLDVAFRVRPPTAVLDHMAGRSLPRRPK
jgi:hypothetical protein